MLPRYALSLSYMIRPLRPRQRRKHHYRDDPGHVSLIPGIGRPHLHQALPELLTVLASDSEAHTAKEARRSCTRAWGFVWRFRYHPG
jgi:hypothetical protein